MSKIEQYKKFKADNLEKIVTIAAQVGEIHEETHWVLIEELKGVLGADAANEASDDEGDQDSSLASAEFWCSENCSGGGVSEDVAMALWLHGMAQGESFVRSQQKNFGARLTTEDIEHVVEDVLNRAKKYGFQCDEDTVRSAIDESVGLLRIELTEDQISRACDQVLETKHIARERSR